METIVIVGAAFPAGIVASRVVVDQVRLVRRRVASTVALNHLARHRSAL